MTRHVLSIGDAAVECSCGYLAKAPGEPLQVMRRSAARHAMSVYVSRPAKQFTTITCLNCGKDLPVSGATIDPMSGYFAWLATPCRACGKAPRDIE